MECEQDPHALPDGGLSARHEQPGLVVSPYFTDVLLSKGLRLYMSPSRYTSLAPFRSPAIGSSGISHFAIASNFFVIRDLLS
jgi:hypothetical protein